MSTMMVLGVLSVAVAGTTASFTVVETGEEIELEIPADLIEPDPYIVGGRQAEIGEWEDAVGVVFGGQYVGCTGTLVAPNVVLTAAHCAGGISHVLVGSNNWIGDQGELLEVRNTIVHPSYDGFNGYDFAVLTLRGESSFAPRTLALDCILDEYLYDGAPVTFAGFGNTRMNGGGSTTLLNVAPSLVRDADCSENRIDGILTGCLPELRPGGEIAAGGRVDIDGDGDIDQTDACFGDSGGPLYLDTPAGSFLIGVTSRGFIGVDPNFPCRDGGIWVRPDAVLRFIENQSGVTLQRPECNEPPMVLVDGFDLGPGKSQVRDVVIDDPDGSFHVIEVLEQPSLGVLTVEGEELVFTAHRGVQGSEVARIAVTDDGSAYEGSPPITVELDVPIVVRRGICGCDAGAIPGIGIPVLFGLLGLIRRRGGALRDTALTRISG